MAITPENGAGQKRMSKDENTRQQGEHPHQEFPGTTPEGIGPEYPDNT